MSGDVRTKFPLESITVTSSPQNNKSRNILKPHKLPKRKLFSDEELRLSKLLEQCISQVETAVTLHLDNLSDIKDKEMRTVFQKHQVLCERLEEANSFESKDDGKAKESADARIESKVKNSYKNVMRVLQNNPEDSFHLSLVPDEDSGGSEQLLIKSLKTFYHYTLENMLKLNSPEAEHHLKVKPLQVSKRMEASLDKRTARLAKLITDIDEQVTCSTLLDFTHFFFFFLLMTVIPFTFCVDFRLSTTKHVLKTGRNSRCLRHFLQTKIWSHM